MKYLVTGTNGPGFASASEAVAVLQEVVIPSFQLLMQYEKDGIVVAGGLPVGDRAFVCIIEAASNEQLDLLLRKIPMWGALDWKVTPLQSFKGRMEVEQDELRRL